MTRAAARARLLRESGWDMATCRPLAADASFRRYERLTAGDGSAVLMDAPPAHEDIRPFMAVADLLRRWGFFAPAPLAADIPAGYLLLEDFGDDSFNRILARAPSRELDLYKAATDLLVALHRFDPPPRIDLPAYDIAHDLPSYGLDMLEREAALFGDWYLPALHDNNRATTLAREGLSLWRDLLSGLPPHGPVLTLRDYHADNLFWLADRSGHACVGLLDFQDAVRGHPAYDLVSLLQDARRPVTAELEDAMIARYIAQRRKTGAPLDEAAFRHAYRLLGAQRATKIIGIFMRLARRDGKTRYPAMIPGIWDYLERDLAAAGCEPLRNWLDTAAAWDIRHRPPDFHD